MTQLNASQFFFKDWDDSYVDSTGSIWKLVALMWDHRSHQVFETWERVAVAPPEAAALPPPKTPPPPGGPGGLPSLPLWVPPPQPKRRPFGDDESSRGDGSGDSKRHHGTECIDDLECAVGNPKTPMAAIVGREHSPVDSNWDEADEWIMEARGLSVGSSLLEVCFIELTKSLEEYQKARGVELLPPSGVGCGNELPADGKEKEFKVGCNFGIAMWFDENQLAEKDL